jgi:hypothetical protein
MRAILTIALLISLASAPVLARGKPDSRRADTADAAPTAEAADEDQGLGPLLHASPAAVRARLGDPDVARAEGKGAFWTYRLPHCALFLFFREGPKGLRISGASTGPRRRGEPAMSVSACLATAVQLPDS